MHENKRFAMPHTMLSTTRNVFPYFLVVNVYDAFTLISKSSKKWVRPESTVAQYCLFQPNNYEISFIQRIARVRLVCSPNMLHWSSRRSLIIRSVFKICLHHFFPQLGGNGSNKLLSPLSLFIDSRLYRTTPLALFPLRAHGRWSYRSLHSGVHPWTN